jgi:hypothetical protein
VASAKPLGELQGAGGGGDLADRAQRRPRLVGAKVLEVGEALRPGQLGLGDSRQELARAGAAIALLDRGGAAVGGDLAVEQADQPRPPRQLARDRQARVRCEALLVGANLDPSGRFPTVSRVHLLGDLHSFSWLGFGTCHDSDSLGRKGPGFRGFSAGWRSAGRQALGLSELAAPRYSRI